MAERLQEVNSDGTPVTARPTTTRVVDDTATTDTVVADRTTVRPTSLAARIVWFIAGVIIVLLAFRFVFVLLGANPSNGFANFIYTASHPFAAPFFGLFGYSLHYGVSRFELSTLVAMLVYALIAYGLARLFTIADRQPRTV